MQSNFTIANQDIVDKAIELSVLRDFKELPCTDQYPQCDRLIINNDEKTYWFTKATTLSHTIRLIQSLNKTVNYN